MLAGYIGASERFDQAITRFAETYADQTEQDWRQLVKHLKHTASKPPGSADDSAPKTAKKKA